MSDFKYHRVSSRFWTDEKVMQWDGDTRLLALYLLTCPHRTTEGLFRLPKPYIAADLGWPMERLAKPFAQLLSDGFMRYDESVSVMLFPNALKYQAPKNPNQAIAAARAVVELPQTPLLSEFRQLAKQFSERLADQLDELLGEPPAPPPAPSPTQQTDGAGGNAEDDLPETPPTSFGQSVGPVDDELPDPHDDMTLQDVAHRYQQRIGIMGPGVFATLQEWHSDRGMSAGALAAAIDLTTQAKSEGRIRGHPDGYLNGVMRGMHNDGIRTVADFQRSLNERLAAQKRSEGAPNAAAFEAVDSDAVRRWREMYADEYAG